MDIIVLCGGISTEREVSIKSGSNVCEALREKGHNAILLDSFFGNDDLFILEKTKEDYDVEKAAAEIRSRNSDVPKEDPTGDAFMAESTIEICRKSDMVFMALHGKYGEDGATQAIFDVEGIRYTGSGTEASRIGMDKGATKEMFFKNNIPCPKSVTIRKGESTDLKDYGMEVPVVVKACNCGSSLGVVIVKNQEDYQAAVDECFTFDNQIIVEDFVEGREFSVGVISGKALPVVEIIPLQGWYDYENKYKEGAVREDCPADITEEERDKMQKAAEDACRVIGVEPYGRCDIIMDAEGNIYCLEVNTLPGMTKTSLIPREAQALGEDFSSLCDRLVKLSLEKYGAEVI